MKKLLLATAAALAALPALAADLPAPVYATKAPVGYPTGCGAYFGINTLGSTASVQGAPVGQQMVQGDIGGTLGYTCPFAGNGYWFVEGMVDWANLNGSQNGLALTGPVHLSQRVAVSPGPLLDMLPSLFPTLKLPAVPSLPILPPGVTSAPGAMYLHAQVDEQDYSASLGLATAREWLVSYGAGVGMLYRLSNGVVADTWITVKTETQSLCLGPVAAGCPKLGTGAEVGFALKY